MRSNPSKLDWVDLIFESGPYGPNWVAPNFDQNSGSAHIQMNPIFGSGWDTCVQTQVGLVLRVNFLVGLGRIGLVHLAALLIFIQNYFFGSKRD